MRNKIMAVLAATLLATGCVSVENPFEANEIPKVPSPPRFETVTTSLEAKKPRVPEPPRFEMTTVRYLEDVNR